MGADTQTIAIALLFGLVQPDAVGSVSSDTLSP